MGMTIDEAIEILQERNNCMEYVTDNDSEAFEMAVDTMRKYQKIEEILRTDFEEYYPLDRDPYKLHLIEKVMLDGNDNR